MLGFMRKHARSGVIKIIFLMIIIVFVFWGVGVMVGGGSRVNVAAMVDGDSITCWFNLADGSTVSLQLKVSGETMTGGWQHSDGGTGELSLERKK